MANLSYGGPADAQGAEHLPATSLFSQNYQPHGPVGSAFENANYDGYSYNLPDHATDRAGSVTNGYTSAGHGPGTELGYDGRSAFALAKQFSGFSIGPNPQFGQDSSQRRYGPSRSMNLDHNQGSPTRRRMSGPLPGHYGPMPSLPGRGRGGYGGRSPAFHTNMGAHQQQQQQQPQPPQAQNGRGEGERGQGYRKLWQQVTKVGRGQKLGTSHEAVPFSDMTVEDLLRIIRNLPPEESAVQAVGRGLYYLDSRALAALLKELHKVGLSNRASELFDWLRGLPDGHDLAHLCDVYTYTTIISQCGSHQQLRKALELVAEMRGHGIPCNVHTYSALMNVCIKANELDLALDVYNQLLREGCTPNLVTYNILIDVHGKTGQWQEAVKVLDALESQGTKAEVRTYNTIINACNRSSQPEYALKVYERMLADGAQPTATTYTALISAYGKTGKVEEALRIFQDMVARGCERNVITYSSLISACEKAGRWQLALELFDEMHRDACKPNVVTYNALIAACGQAGQWKAASEVFEGMANSGCKPDSVTYGTLVAALDKGGQWTRALEVFEEMQGQGHRPDVGVFNVIMEVLVRSGSWPGQMKALQLFQAASRLGQLRLMPQGTADVTVIAFTVGAAALLLLQWLQLVQGKLASKASNPSPLPSPQQQQQQLLQTASSAGSPANTVFTSPSHSTPIIASPAGSGDSLPPLSPLTDRATLLLLKGKHGRSESSPVTIEQALTVLLVAANVPFAISHTWQGVRVEVDIGCNASWPEGPELEAVLVPLVSAASCKLPTELLINEEHGIDARCRTAYAAVQEFEESHPAGSKPVGDGDEAVATRQEALTLLLNIGNGFGLSEEVRHDSVQLLDRLLRRGMASQDAKSPLVLSSIALLAARQGDRQGGLPTEATIENVAGVSPEAVGDMQENLSVALQGDTGAISALRVLHLYLERLVANLQDARAMSRVAGDATQILTEALFEPELWQFPPSLVAAAVLFVARRKAGLWPFWPQALAMLTGLEEPSIGAFAAAVDIASRIAPPVGVPARLQMSPSQLPLPPPVAPTPPSSFASAAMLRQASMGSVSTDLSRFNSMLPSLPSLPTPQMSFDLGDITSSRDLGGLPPRNPLAIQRSSSGVMSPLPPASSLLRSTSVNAPSGPPSRTVSLNLGF